MTIKATATATARRGNAGVERRRRAILAAARMLLNREPLSMRRLAEAAGVSEATPYNLFGSKQALFVALYHEQRAGLAAHLDESGLTDGLDRMFHAVHLMARELADEPAFFRALFGGVFATPLAPAAAALGDDPGVVFWRERVQELIDQRLLAPGTDGDGFAQNFVHLVAGAVMDWASGRIDAEAWERTVSHGLALLAVGAVVEPARQRLKTRLARN